MGSCMIVTGTSEAHGNALLAALPRFARKGGSKRSQIVTVNFGDVLHDGRSTITHVYFPTTCVISLLTEVADHPAVAVSMVGSEGVVGVSVALGVLRPVTRSIVQGSGSAVRMTARVCSEELLGSAALRKSVALYTDSLLSQLMQTAACNTFHPLEARLARWLLMTRDRTHSDQLEVTQEFLAQMLGVRRVGVTVAAGNLQRRGIIAYSRGRIAILDQARLSKAACECYAALPALIGTNFLSKNTP
jgi:hypothetical protein